MRPGWCGKLATGLAGHGVDIRRGDAVQTASGSWRAEFVLTMPVDCEIGSDDITALMATDAGAGFTSRIVLFDYRLEESDAHQGCLRLDVEGEDRLGFLAALLRRLAFLSLFPVEFRLETVEGHARDRLWLRGGLGCAPQPNAMRTLAANLEALVPSAGSPHDRAL